MDMSAFASASEAQKKKTKIPIDEPPDLAKAPTPPAAPEAPAPSDNFQIAIKQLLELQQSGFSNPTQAQKIYQQFQTIIQNNPQLAEPHLAMGYLLLVYNNAYHALEPLSQASQSLGEAKNLLESAEAIVAKEKAAIEKPKSKVKSRIKRARRITEDAPAPSAEETPNTPKTYQPKPIQFQGPILEELATLRLSILAPGGTEGADDELDKYDQLYDEVENMLAQQTQKAMSQSRLIKVSLETDEVEELQSFFTELKGRVKYINKQIDVLSDEFDEEDVEELKTSLKPLETILKQTQKALDLSNTLGQLKRTIGETVTEIHSQIEQAESLDKAVLTNNFNTLFDRYETIADQFDELEAQGIDLELMMYHLNKLSKALDELQGIVEG